MSNPVQDLLDVIGTFNAGDAISAARMNKIIEALRLALNITGDGVTVDKDGIHIRRPPGVEEYLCIAHGAPRLIAGEAWRWETPFSEAEPDPDQTSKRRLRRKQGGITSWLDADPYFCPAINIFENGNRAKNGTSADMIGVIAPGINLDGTSYPSQFTPRALGPDGSGSADVAAAFIVKRLGTWGDGKPFYAIQHSTAHDGTCS